MPIRSDWSWPREGFTLDVVNNLLKYTALNPLNTLPLYLAGLYTESGKAYAASNPRLFKALQVCLALGVWNRISNFLNKGAANNWVSDKYDWKKEIVVVTGGSDGIGAIATKLLAEKGIKVAVLDIQKPKYDTPPNVHYFNCDLASPSAIKATADEIRTHLGNPTVLVNNAGFVRGRSILDATQSDISLTFDINSKAHYFLAQEFLPYMIQKNHGMVVTVASLAAFVTAPSMVDYAASKAAAVSFHEGLTAELVSLYKAPKVRTVLMCQGYTNTALFKGFHAGDGFAQYQLAPETVAEDIAKAVLSGRSANLVLPRNNFTILGLRGWPLFMQLSLRGNLTKLMKNWQGRQVVQPSEASGDLSESKSYEKVEK